MSRVRPRQIVEPGGILLITLGMDMASARAEIAHLYPLSSSLTLLISPDQQALRALADEAWTYGPLGFAGFLALMRRVSWRHFEAVYQPAPDALPALRFLVWPRPPWHLNKIGG